MKLADKPSGLEGGEFGINSLKHPIAMGTNRFVEVRILPLQQVSLSLGLLEKKMARSEGHLFSLNQTKFYSDPD
ncbi:hypothetical protein [Fulvivirga marina]|uniref:hypothetical protein n=1 Tax=Fulvivirga marina TaxID=2494733 RepID=UPI00192D73D9|nr:hypothetical protein [Fulvivirga marina]